jgi:cytochrome P450
MGDPLAAFDPFGEEFVADRYAVYRRYRDAGPVHFGAPAVPGATGTWYVFGHGAVAAGLKDTRCVRELGRLVPAGSLPEMPEPYRPFWDMARRWMLFKDPPDHTRLRSLVSQAFTPRRVRELEPRIEAAAADLLDGARRLGGVDLIADYAYPLPVLVIAELLGVDASERHALRRWSAAIGAAIDLRTSSDAYLAASAAAHEVKAFLQGFIDERTREPRDDLISDLITSRDDDERLDDEELVATLVLLLIAGHETTTNLIGNGTLALLEHPEQLELLRADSSLVPNAVEELLRFDSPVQATFRHAGEAMVIGDRAIARLDQVGFLIGAANRDPAVFDDPDRLDVTRSVGRHSAFGLGIHFCLGAPLARLEATIAFRTLLDRAPGLALATSEPAWREGVGFRGLEALPVTLG